MSRSLASAVLLIAALAAPAARGGEMEKKIDGLARNLAGLLEQRNETRIAMGEFTGAAALKASAGPAIADALAGALTKHKVSCDEQASLEIRGEYFLTGGGASGPAAALKIKFQVVDTNDGRREVSAPAIDLFDAATVARLTGATGELSGRSNGARSKKLAEALKAPKVRIERGQRDSAPASLVSAPGSPYAIEVLVKEEAGGPSYTPRAATAERGRAFVDLKRSEVYAVRLHNSSPLDAAVELCVDGVNVFALHREPGMRDARVIIPAGGTALVRGYAISDSESREFLLAGMDAPVDGRLLPKGSPKLGTITALFSAAWKEGDAPPRDEPQDPVTEGAEENRTIPGAGFAERIRRVPMEIGKPRAQVSIRYNKGGE